MPATSTTSQSRSESAQGSIVLTAFACTNPKLDAIAAMAAIQADPDVLADPDLAPFTKVRGATGAMTIGDRYVIEITGPWKGAVEVVDVTPHSFRFTTLEGHMESGLIDMRTTDVTSDVEPPAVEFTIESWARSHDHFLDVLYDKLGIAKAVQAEMWSIACDRFTELVEGESVGRIEVVTERASESPSTEDAVTREPRGLTAPQRHPR